MHCNRPEWSNAIQPSLYCGKQVYQDSSTCTDTLRQLSLDTGKSLFISLAHKGTASAEKTHL